MYVCCDSIVQGIRDCSRLYGVVTLIRWPQETKADRDARGDGDEDEEHPVVLHQLTAVRQQKQLHVRCCYIKQLNKAVFLLICVLGVMHTSNASPLRVCVLTETQGWVHTSLDAARTALDGLAAQRGWQLTRLPHSSFGTGAALARDFDVIIFALTTGDVLNSTEQQALREFISLGKGWVGIHSASDTEYDWPWYAGLVGAYFHSHPAVQDAIVQVTDRYHPSTRTLPVQWAWRDEFYNWRASPRGAVHVLARVDEDSYIGGTHGWDHPVSWCQMYSGGRSWYTRRLTPI